jgi:hypothetical protein
VWTPLSDVLSVQVGPLESSVGRLFAANFEDPSGGSLVVREGGDWLSTGVNAEISDMTTLGPWLIAAGYLGRPVYLSVAGWDGSGWVAVPSPSYSFSAQSVFGDGLSLWIGAQGYPAVGAIARWDWDGVVPAGVSPDAFNVGPSPFQSSTTLRFSLSHAGNARISIHDVTGREVTRLWNGFSPAGAHALTWDGTDRRGRRSPPGIYFARMTIEGRAAQTQRIALIR